MDIHVTNLDLNLVEGDIQRLFTPFGEISSIIIVRDKINNRSKGHAIINMPRETQAQQAIVSLNGTQVGTKSIMVASIYE